MESLLGRSESDNSGERNTGEGETAIPSHPLFLFNLNFILFCSNIVPGNNDMIFTRHRSVLKMKIIRWHSMDFEYA